MPRLKLISSPRKANQLLSLNLNIDINNDLEKIYQAAFDSGHYTAALKAKELQLKIQLARGQSETDISDSLCNLSNDQLKEIINRLEKNNSTLNI